MQSRGLSITGPIDGRVDARTLAGRFKQRLQRVDRVHAASLAPVGELHHVNTTLSDFTVVNHRM